MRVPYLGGALKGWTAPTPVRDVTQTVVDHEVVEIATDLTLDMNAQPMPPSQVNRKPEEQRTWLWWTFIIRGSVPSTVLKVDSVVFLKGKTFRVQSGLRDWTTSGFSICEAIEDFTPPPSVPSS
jgi:hypothetical protein